MPLRRLESEYPLTPRTERCTSCQRYPTPVPLRASSTTHTLRMTCYPMTPGLSLPLSPCMSLSHISFPPIHSLPTACLAETKIPAPYHRHLHSWIRPTNFLMKYPTWNIPNLLLRSHRLSPMIPSISRRPRPVWKIRRTREYIAI